MLTPPIEVSGLSAPLDIINHAHDLFKNDFLNKSNRENLFGKFIYVDCSNWVEYKAAKFWHASSLSQIERFNVFPCTNDIANSICNNCICPSPWNIELPKQPSGVEVRKVCLYRALRTNWINQIIAAANVGSPNVRWWIKDGKTHIRYVGDGNDYVIILENVMNQNNVEKYNFITSFPVFYINKKETFDNDYNSFTP